MLMYGINVKHLSKIVQWLPRLQQVTVQKLRGAAADSIKQILSQHDRRMDESLDEDARKGRCSVRNFIHLYLKCVSCMGSGSLNEI